MRFFIWVLFSILMPLFAVSSWAAVPFKVLSVSPQGTIKSPQQIRVQFSSPVVRFGDAKTEAPVQSDCFKGGQGRWIDPTNWVYDFDIALGSGLNCSIQIKSIKNLNGEKLTGRQDFKFSTGEADILSQLPSEGESIDPEQVFVFFMDGPVSAQVIQQKAFFVIAGLGDKIPVVLVTGSEQQKILQAAFKANRWTEFLSKKNNEVQSSKPLVTLKAARPFPFGGKVTFSWPRPREFQVQEDFRAQFSCTREKPEQPCLPLLNLSLNFTASFSHKQGNEVFLLDPKGKKIFAKNENGVSSGSISSLEFEGPFAENAKYELHLPKNLKDENQRPLANADQFPLKIQTGAFPSLLKFAAPFGILEAKSDPILPVTVRQIEKKILTRIAPIGEFKGGSERITAAEFGKAIARLKTFDQEPTGTAPVLKNPSPIQINKPGGEKDFEVIGIPLKTPGLYAVEMQSPQLAKSLTENSKNYFVRTLALVTSMAVHLKYTEQDAFVWVTDLETSNPLAKAQVELFTCDGKSLGKSVSDAQGIARVHFAKNPNQTNCAEGGSYSYGFFAVASLGQDFSFVHSSWSRGIETWRYQVNTWNSEKNYAHTILDRTLLMPGETVSMKHILREPRSEGLGFVNAASLPTEMEIEHESGEQKFSQKITWNRTGSSLGQWKIPEGAKLGRWMIYLKKSDQRIESAEFRVENFRVPNLKAHLQTPTNPLIQNRQIPVQIGIEYLAGGPASDLDVVLRWRLEDSSFDISDQEDDGYAFAKGGLKEGMTRQNDDEEDSQTVASAFSQKSFKLDKNGGRSFDVGNFNKFDQPKDVRIEAEYRDPNGEIQTSSRKVTIWPSELLIGLKPTSWNVTKDNLSYDILVLDVNQKPVAGKKVEITLYQREYISHRQRLVGGFYAYENFVEVKKLSRLCQGETNAKGFLRCQGKSSVAGNLVAVASAKDAQGRPSLSQVSQYVVGKEKDLWYGASDNDRIDLISDKKFYEPGETAVLQMKSPFRQQKVLLTIEREGVIEHQILDVTAENPNIKIKIKPEWAPNVFFSVLALRGRVADYKPTALADLGRPSFKMGLTGVQVGWKKHELNVQVSTDKKIYRVREKAKAHIMVKDSQGRPVSGELALAVVDEGLLELRPNKTWNLLAAMMKARGLQVNTSTAQTQVVGKRHFGMKALAPGGDGRGASARELFDTLLLWKGQMTLNKGQADIEIPINDSLTKFRVVAIATSGTDQFGTGANDFQTTQDLMIFAGLAPEVRQGDQVFAEYTLRNVTDQKQDLNVSLQVEGGESSSLPTQKVFLSAKESKEITWPIAIASAGSELRYQLKVTNAQGRVLDQIVKKQKVKALWAPQVQQAQLISISGEAKLPLQTPPQAERGSVQIKLGLSPSFVGSRKGIEEFWKNYEYTCLEQQVSRFVSLGDRKAWDKLAPKLESYLDANGLLKFFPSEKEGSEILTAYVLSLLNESAWPLPPGPKEKMLEALQGVIAGRVKLREAVSFADRDLRKVMMFDALSRYGKFKIEDLTTLNLQPQAWPTSSLVTWYGLLLRETKIQHRTSLLAEAENLVRARMSFSGTRFSFADEKEDRMWWLMSTTDTPLLKLILIATPLSQWKQDVPKLIKSSLDRQVKGSWQITSANAWGSLAMNRYAKNFEKNKVSGMLSAQWEEQSKKWNWSQGTGELIFHQGKTAPAQSEMKLHQQGDGVAYASVYSVAAIPILQPVNSGFKVEKSISPEKQRKSGSWSRGDIMKVRLKITSMADSGWVVVNDPLPAGASVISNENSVGMYPAFAEKTFTSYRLYYSRVPQGSFEIEYLLRFNQAGSFVLPETRVEGLYTPDLFGALPNQKIEVQL